MSDTKNLGGRPTDYYDKVKPFLKEISYWVLLGYTHKEIAQKLNINIDTYCEYRKRYPEFAEAIKKNAPLPKENVVNALYQRAVGYEFEEVSTVEKPVFDKYGNPKLNKDGTQLISIQKTVTKKQLAPDIKAIQTFLLNRDRQNWQLTSGFKIEDKREKDTTDIDKVFDLLDQSRKELLEKESENK